MAKAKAEELDPKKIAEAIKDLSPEEAEFFIARLESVFRKRKLQAVGYLVAMGAWAVAMFFAWVYYGTQDGFVGWIFLVPFALVGVILLAFGRWADHVGKAVRIPHTAPPSKPE